MSCPVQNISVTKYNLNFFAWHGSCCIFSGSDGRVCRRCWRPALDPWVRNIPWRRKWQPTPVFLPGKSHEWRSLAGYRPWGRKESDTTEQLHFHVHSFFFFNYFFNFYFYCILLYNTVLVLPYVDMNPPRVYMRSQT